MTEPLPRVSWLIPVYNGEPFLTEALDSVLAQDFADYEVVIVNDGSTDRTGQILAEFCQRDPRIRVIEQPNGGIVSALNTGLAECRGEFVARMDADDIALPQRLSFQVDYLDTHPGCVLVGGYAVSRDAAGRITHRTNGGRHTRTDLGVFPPRVSVSMHPLITVRRASLEAIGGYRADHPHAEDYDLFIRLAALGSLDNPERDVLVYRRHEGAISIRHVETQERSAAMAEVEAIARSGGTLPDWLVEPYIRLRIFRRYNRVDPVKARAALGTAFGDLLQLRPAALLDKRYLRLRAILAVTIGKHLQRAALTALGRLTLGPNAISVAKRTNRRDCPIHR